VEEFQLEVEASDSGTRERLSTLALGYPTGGREKSGIVAPKGYGSDDLGRFCFVQILWKYLC
jgi:hypothetical protein